MCVVLFVFAYINKKKKKKKKKKHFLKINNYLLFL